MLVTTRGYLGLSGGGCLPTDGHFNGEHDVFEPHDSEDTTNTTNTCDLFRSLWQPFTGIGVRARRLKLGRQLEWHMKHGP
jgi:hypothetical protein